MREENNFECDLSKANLQGKTIQSVSIGTYNDNLAIDFSDGTNILIEIIWVDHEEAELGIKSNLKD